MRAPTSCVRRSNGRLPADDFAPLQALAAAKCDATCQRPSDTWMTSEDGFQIVEQMVQILPNDDAQPGFWSPRCASLTHFLRAAELAPTWRGCPFSLLRQILHHPLTYKGLDAFPADRRKTTQEDSCGAARDSFP